MAQSSEKYATSPEGEDQSALPKDALKLASLKDDHLSPVVLPDGTVRVHNLEEVSSKSLSYDLDQKNNVFYFEKELDENTTCKYMPKNIDKVYETKVSYKGEVKNAYAIFKSDVKRFVTKSLDRYKTAPKKLKKEIDKVLKNKNEFIFTDDRYPNSHWNKIYIDSTNLGPYNYDVRLHVSQEIEFINDLIVIRSGSFDDVWSARQKGWQHSQNSWGIAWVSPHKTITYRGDAIYTHTGTETQYKVEGGLSETSPTGYYNSQDYVDKVYKVTNQSVSYALSSRDMAIPVDQYLHSGLLYFDEEKDGRNYTHVPDLPKYQDFMYRYAEYTGNYCSGGWDGVIPSGVPFSIETWSTNPKYIGFNGEITVKPVDDSAPSCFYSAECEGVGSDLEYQASVRKAIKKAKSNFYKKLNKILISKGIKNKGSKTKRYERLIERVAQNVYDGLSMIRNDQLAKVQGLEANPLGGPIYYDGTIKQYGGNKDAALYNYADTLTERTTRGGTTGGTGSSSSGGGGGGGSY